MSSADRDHRNCWNTAEIPGPEGRGESSAASLAVPAAGAERRQEEAAAAAAAGAAWPLRKPPMKRISLSVWFFRVKELVTQTENGIAWPKKCKERRKGMFWGRTSIFWYKLLKSQRGHGRRGTRAKLNQLILSAWTNWKKKRVMLKVNFLFLNLSSGLRTVS